MKPISLKEIANITGASPTTVSLVLNGKGRISEAVRQKILQAVKDNGYEPNRIAISLRTGHSNVLGVIVDDIGGPFFGALAKIIEVEAEKFGFRIIYCSSENNLEKARELISMLSHQLVDGYIIMPVPGLQDEILNLKANHKPVVLIDGYYPELDIPHVLVDNLNSVMQGMSCLIEAGHRKIGFVTVDIDLIQIKERLRGYFESLKKFNLKADDKLVLKLPYQMDKGKAVQAVKDLFGSNRDMDAVFFSTNYLGIIGIESIQELGLSIPKDIAVICFDDLEIFRLLPPGISSIQQPVLEIGRTATDLLLAMLGKKKNHLQTDKITIPANLIIRGSIKAINVPKFVE
ncbi:MAG: LacI family transcriptional regulator [Mucilaginibacter sp.]|nr:LacI family transcriptional regulator [Mucilaginibacter sp.]